MTKDNIIEIIKKTGLFQYNIFDDHPQKANEVILRKEDSQYIVFSTDEENIIKGNILTFNDENEAIDNFINQLHKLKDRYLSSYIEDNYHDYYQKRYKEKPFYKIFFSWKWPPFFLGYGWLIYRKMYLETLILFIILIISGNIIFFINGNDRIFQIVYDSMRILLSIFGNSLYYYKISRVIKKLKNIDEREHIKYLIKHGGTNIILAILIALLYLAIIIVPFFI